MRRLLAATLFALPLLSGAAPSDALAQGQPPLRCAVDGTFAPHAFPRLEGGVQGFQIDLFREVARRMGREITIDSASFSGLIPALNAGRYDFLCAPTTVTPERAASAALHRRLHLDRAAVRHPPRHDPDPIGGRPPGQGDQRQQGHAV